MVNHDNEGRGTASHFADWVFKKTNPDYQRDEYTSTIANRQALGKFAHKQIDNLQFWMKSVKAADGISSKWELVYSDPHDGSEKDIFYASRLIVDCDKRHEAMKCRPDVVFRDTETGLIIVVERKITGWQDWRVPSDAWPNVRAQFWCYGWIDDWMNALDVILVSQFWRRRIDSHRQDIENPWILNYEVHPGWRRSNPNFHSECLHYFNDYGGRFL